MLLNNIPNAELISRMEKLVRSERKITHLVLLHIIEIEDRKLFASLGYDGMYSYLTKGLGYSESSAYRRLQSARLLRNVPDVAAKIEDGKLNLSQLTKVQKCLREQSQSTGEALSPKVTMQILEKIEHKSVFETERVLSTEFDRPIQTQESLKPQKDDSVRLEITLTHEQFAELEQAKSLLSHFCHEGSWSEVIAQLAKAFNRKKLQPEKELKQNPENPKLIASKSNTVTQSFAAKTISRPRVYIPVSVKRAVYNKAEGCCDFIDPNTKTRCQSKYQLQIDHIQPWSMGGSNELSNLRLLCRTHNNSVYTGPVVSI